MLKFRGLDGRHAVLRFALFLLLVPATALCGDAPRQFDLPAQPMDQALERFSIETGWSVMYIGGLTDGLVNRPVHAMLPPDEALQRLIAGSGLERHMTAPERAILRRATAVTLPEASEPQLDATASRQQFAGLQRRLAETFCDDRLLRPGRYGARIEFTVTTDGRLQDLHLQAATGHPKIDQRLLQALSALRVDPAAAALQQPVVLHIQPQRSARDCGGVRSTP